MSKGTNDSGTRTKDPQRVGLAYINCPSCGTLIEVPVQLQALRIGGGNSGFYADFLSTRADHICEGRTTR